MDWREYSKPCRVAMPREERRHPWLGLLLDAYAIIDKSMADAVDAAGGTACQRGCHYCCHQPIPVTPLEVTGLRFFSAEVMTPGILSALVRQSEAQPSDTSSTCRFLWHGACAAYPLRPIACRRYGVAGLSCREGEDATCTRPQDVLQPSREALIRALALTLPLYGDAPPEINDKQVFPWMLERSVALSSISADILLKAAQR